MAAGRSHNIEGRIMSLANETGSTPSTLVLLGLPGLEPYHIWFAAPLTAIYIMTLLGNCTLLLVIKSVVSLHTPMYLIVCQLAFTDLTLSSCVLPKMLSILWFDDGEISFNACLMQMCLSIFVLALESSILSAMAFDRYVAVCNPLRYSSILTNSLLVKIATAIVARAMVIVVPIPLLTMRLTFCGRHVSHSYCENMAVAKLSCSDITANNIYGLAISLLIAPVDIACIALSYILILKTILHLPLKEDRIKAFSTCGTHISVISAFYIPLFSSVVLHRLHPNIPLYMHVIVSNICLLLSPLMNPLMYGLTMKDVQKGIDQLFQRVKYTLTICV